MGLIAIFYKFAKHKYNAILKNSQKHIASACVLIALSQVFFTSPGYSANDGKLGLRTICIDPGHGGKDPGCVSLDKKTHESKINLDIATRLAEMIRKEHPDVKVVMTRKTDVFVTLVGRAEIANRNNADLFLSIHVNSTPGTTSANGYSIHVLGQSTDKNRDLFAYNMDVCKRENSVIMMEDDYSTTYQSFDPSDPESFIFLNLMQNAHLEQSLLLAQDIETAMSAGPVQKSRGVWQNPFLVLWKTSMPSALVEVGFMTNARDLAVLRSESGREGIAKDICKAFGQFKKRYDASVGNTSCVSEVPEPDTRTPDTQSNKESAIRYGIQVLATNKTMKDSDPFFKGYKPTLVKKGNLNKYLIGVSGDKEEVRKLFNNLKKTYSGSFIVEISDGDAKLLR